MAEQIRVHIRWMIRRDMPEVLEMENSVDHSWTEEDFLRCLRQRNCIPFAAEIGEKVVGYLIYEMHKTHFEVLRIVVHPDYRRRDVGGQMIRKLMSKLSSRHRTHLLVYVRESNLPLQLLLRRCKLIALRVRRRWFSDTSEDAYLMRYVLPDLSPEERAEELAEELWE